MSNNQEIKYRVFDHKDGYQQTYSAQLEGAFTWAKSCANRVNGYVMEISFDGNKEKSSRLIYSSNAK